MQERYRRNLIEGEKAGQRYRLVIPQTALAGRAGELLGRRAGTSIDFQDYREYHPGDDIRTIDWNIFARSDKLTVKLFREEVHPHLDLLIDTSRSMDLENSPKADATLALAGLLASAATNAGCSHNVWLAGEGFRRVENDTLRPSAWSGIEFDGRRGLDDAHAIFPPQLRRLAIRVLISDLLWPEDPRVTLRKFADGAAAMHVIQLLAQDDLDPPDPGSIRLEDAESGQSLDLAIDATLQQRYRDALKNHQQAWHDACRQHGVRITTLVADQLNPSLHRLEEMELIAPE